MKTFKFADSIRMQTPLQTMDGTKLDAYCDLMANAVAIYLPGALAGDPFEIFTFKEYADMREAGRLVDGRLEINW